MSLEETEEEDRWPRRYTWPAMLIVALAGWWGIASMLAGCVAPRPAEPPVPFQAAKQTTIEQALAPPLWPALRSLVAEAPPTTGAVRRLHGKTACEATIPLPYIIPADRIPRVGEEWECLFVTSVSSLPPEPDWFAWLVVSTRPPAKELPVELSPLGMPGCVLHVNPEQLISVPPGFEAPPGAMLSRVPGRGQIRLRWTPAGGMAGQQLWIQLLVHAPGRSPGGFLISYAIEITVAA